MPGIVRSVTTASTPSRRVNASRPLAAVTGSWPRSRSTSFSVKSTDGSSSTSRTLPMRGGLAGSRREPHGGDGAAAGLALEAEIAAVLADGGAGEHHAEAGAALARGEE